jgi:endoglucanase
VETQQSSAQTTKGKKMKLIETIRHPAIVIAAVLTLSMSAQAWQGMPTPKLHVTNRFLQDPTGKSVLLHGYFQPQASWFNGEGNRYANPTDYTSTANVAGCLNFLRDAATVMSDTTPKYGRTHGWYSSFVRIIGDGSSPENFAPGWNASGQLANSAQFNGWINNLLVPYINHCRSRGLYVVICGNRL